MEPEKTPRERAFLREVVPAWRPTRPQVLWIIRITVAVVLALIVIALLGVVLWTVLSTYIAPQTATERKDLVQSFALAVAGAVGSLSALVAVGNLYVSRRNLQQQQVLEFQRAEQQRQLEFQRAEQQRQLEERRSLENTLPAYLDQMVALLFDKERPLRRSKQGDEVRTLARVRTITALARLDSSRKGVVMRFLIESGLAQQESVRQDQPASDRLRASSIMRWLRKRGPRQEEHMDRQPIISLSGASLKDTDLSAVTLVGADLSDADLRNTDLSTADLRGAKLRNTDLRGAHAEPRETLKSVDLEEADLEDADLRDTDFRLANMTRAHLHKADLRNANLMSADLTGAWVPRAKLGDANLIAANLTGAHVILADLTNAFLIGADLRNVSLYKSDLSGARGVTNEELDQEAASLEGATMPNGQKYEDWLKDRESRKEDGQNDGSS